MAPMPGTPRRSGAGRPRKSTQRPESSGSSRPDKSTPVYSTSEPPPKKRRYIPGGPGGGGRYVDEDGTEIPVGGTGPGGYNYVGPRGRVGRENAAAGLTPVVYPRRDRSTRTRTVLPRSQQPPMRFSSAAQAAAAVVQSDGYKPREERGWEEFHPNLDIDAKIMVYSAADVDGIPKSRPVTPGGPLSASGSLNGTHTPTGETMKMESFGSNTPTGSMNGDTGKTSSLPGTPPTKRRPGRPPRDPIAFYAARAAAANGESPSTPRIAPLQNQNAKERLTLPQPSYRKVDYLSRFEDKSAGLMRYVEKSMANVGYQESDIFIRPERKLIKVSDSNIEDDLDLAALSKMEGESSIGIGSGGVGRVEYDMDEQDDKWLESYNAQRKAVDVEPITREIFEITITKIEKEWHALEKRIPKPNPKPPQTHRPRSSSAAAVNGEPLAGEEQDSKCAICDDGDCENTNAIVFCDGCDLAVHQECYGVPFIPEGQWLCRKCQLIGRGIPTCIFCPNTDGAFKQTNSSKWAHLLCAMWVPEVSLGNHTFMEPVMDVEKVPKTRWKLNCYICQQRMGACIQCGNKACYQAFHVTCARRSRLFLKMKNSHGQLAELDGATVLKAFCDKHCPSDYTNDNDVVRATREAKIFYRKTMRGRLWADSQASALAMAASHRNAITEHPPDESQATGARLSLTLGDSKKKGNQPAKPVWKLPSGAPVVPSVVYDAVESSLQRFTIRKRKEFAAEACRYWTLKREARRGAALLKRLQLQMETFSSMELTRRNFAGMGPAGRSRLARRIQFAERLVVDLERLKALSESVMERESEKLKEMELEEEAVNAVYFPIWRLLPHILERALILDIKKIFTEGLIKIQMKFDNRYYVLATTLAQDLSSVFSIGIEVGPQIKHESGQIAGQEHISPSKNAAFDIRERRKLAKRIIKAIQPQLELAVRAEADVTRKSADTMVHDLEMLLDACLHSRQEAAPDGSAAHGAPDEMIVDSIAHGGSGPNGLSAPNDAHEISDVNTRSDDMDVDLYDEDAPGEEVDDAELFPAAAVATNSGLSVPANGNAHQDEEETAGQSKPQYLGSGIKSSDTPPDTNGYSSTLEHHQPPPPTPPVSSGEANSTNGQENGGVDCSTSLTEGGIPWYLKSFDPVGTTILEVQWTGRDIVRGMSEELTDIDDDELKGMGADMEGIEDIPEEVITEGKTETALRTKKGKAKKRWRGYRYIFHRRYDPLNHHPLSAADNKCCVGGLVFPMIPHDFSLLQRVDSLAWRRTSRSATTFGLSVVFIHSFDPPNSTSSTSPTLARGDRSRISVPKGLFDHHGVLATPSQDIFTDSCRTVAPKMGESRQELVSWLNNLLQLNITKVEQCGTGAALCQIFDSIYLDVPMQRVKFNVNTEYAYLQNFKILQTCFTRHQIDRPINVEQLIKCKMQDNLEFLQWSKRYWDQYFPGGDYDAVGRRRSSGAPPPTAPPAPRVSAGAGAARRGTTPTTGGPRLAKAGGVGGGAGSAALQQENNTLKETVQGLEVERDFYFSKLRDIELLIQQAVEEDPEIEKQEDGLIKHIQTILYSTEDGFEIPAEAEGVDDQETF